MDFSTAGTTANIINAWVENNTHGMIKDMFSSDSFTEETRLVLANAVYFKGKHIFFACHTPSFKGTWRTAFDKSLTRKDAPFFTLDGTEVKADRMHLQRHHFYASFDSLKAAAVRLPFEQFVLSSHFC